MSGVKIIKIKPEDDGIRLNRWFLKYYPGLSLGRFQKLLRTKQIKVDGAKAEANTRLSVGQEIRIPPLDNEKKAIVHENMQEADIKFIENMVIYKDDNIIVLKHGEIIEYLQEKFICGYDVALLASDLTDGYVPLRSAKDKANIMLDLPTNTHMKIYKDKIIVEDKTIYSEESLEKDEEKMGIL